MQQASPNGQQKPSMRPSVSAAPARSCSMHITYGLKSASGLGMRQGGHFAVSMISPGRRVPLIRTTASRRTAVFFLESSEGLLLPLEPQQLLGLNPSQVYKDSEVADAFQLLVHSQPEVDFSAKTLAARAELLELVRGIIFASKGRKTDRTPEIVIPYDLLPGAMALLTEVGQDKIACSIGQELLATDELDQYEVYKQEVLLSMAQAHTNLAGDLLEDVQQPQRVTMACQNLEEALALLRPRAAGGVPLAPELARNVRASLAELYAQSALEQVSGPIGRAHQEERKHAMHAVRELLRHTDVDVVGLGRNDGAQAPQLLGPELAERLLAQLTCEELVLVHKWDIVARSPNTHNWVYPGLLERVATAHILLGFTQSQPEYIKMALGLLRRLPSRGELLVAQAVCQLLLGAVGPSVALLAQAERGAGSNRLADGAAPSPSAVWSTQALAFVREHTPAGEGEEGLLPGLCLFTAEWLSKVAAPQFRDTVQMPPRISLSSYFDNTRVEALIAVYDEKGDGAAAVGSSMSGLASAWGSAVGSMRTKVEEATGSKGLPRPAFILSVLGLGVFAVGAALFSQQRAPPLILSTSTTAASTSTSASAQTSRTPQGEGAGVRAVMATQLDFQSAERVLREWQAVKASALGPKYESSGLETLLAEPLRGEMTAKQASFKQDGWSMRYVLHGLQVRTIETTSGSVCVTATLEETAMLIATGGKQADTQRSAYDARYTLEQNKEGAWRVSKVELL